MAINPLRRWYLIGESLFGTCPAVEFRHDSELIAELILWVPVPRFNRSISFLPERAKNV